MYRMIKILLRYPKKWLIVILRKMMQSPLLVNWATSFLNHFPRLKHYLKKRLRNIFIRNNQVNIKGRPKRGLQNNPLVLSSSSNLFLSKLQQSIQEKK